MDEKLVICEAYGYCNFKMGCHHRYAHSHKCINTCKGDNNWCLRMQQEENIMVNCKPVEEVIDERERKRLSCNL